MRNPFKQYGDLEYQYKAQVGFQELEQQHWKKAEKIFKDLLWDRPTELAYIGAIQSHMKLRALHTDAVHVPTFEMIDLPPYDERKKVWTCSNMSELEAAYVVEPFFTGEDLKNTLVVDESINHIFEWFLYLTREQKNFITQWHACKYVYDIRLAVSKEGMQEIKDFYYGVVEKYQDMIDFAESIINNHFAKKINEQYEAAFSKAYPGREIVTKTVKPKHPAPKKPVVIPYEPVKAVLKSKNNKKARIAAFSITCGYLLISLLLALLPINFSAQIITILGMLLPAIYTLVKKLLFGTKHPSWVGHFKLFSLGVLIVAVIIPIIDLPWSFTEYLFPAISSYIPLWTLLFVAGRTSNKDLIKMMIALLILTYVGGFGLVGSLLIHIIGVAGAIAVQSNRSALGFTFGASILAFACSTAAIVTNTGDWGYLVINIIALAIAYEILWRAALHEQFSWAVPFPLCIAIGRLLGMSGASGYSGSGSGSSYDNSGYSNNDEEESSSSGGYDWAEMDRYRQQEAAAFAQAEEERRREADEAYAQSYGFDSAQDAQDHGFM